MKLLTTIWHVKYFNDLYGKILSYFKNNSLKFFIDDLAPLMRIYIYEFWWARERKYIVQFNHRYATVIWRVGGMTGLISERKLPWNSLKLGIFWGGKHWPPLSRGWVGSGSGPPWPWPPWPPWPKTAWTWPGSFCRKFKIDPDPDPVQPLPLRRTHGCSSTKHNKTLKFL